MCRFDVVWTVVNEEALLRIRIACLLQCQFKSHFAWLTDNLHPFMHTCTHSRCFQQLFEVLLDGLETNDSLEAMIDSQLLQHDVGVLSVGVGEDVLLRRNSFEHRAESFVSLDHLLVRQLPMHVVVPIIPVDVVTMRCQSCRRRAMLHVQLHAQTRHVSCWDAQLALHVRTNVVPNVLCNLRFAIQSVVQIHEQDVHRLVTLLHRCGGAHVDEYFERTSLHGRARVSVHVERTAKFGGKQDPTRKGRDGGNQSDEVVDAKFRNLPSMKGRKTQGAPAGEASRTTAEEGAR